MRIIVTAAFLFASLGSLTPEVVAHGSKDEFEGSRLPVNEVVTGPIDGGIREDVPDKLKARFAKWKAELLSTEFGKKQWSRYAEDHNFLLIIRVDRERGRGAGTDKFLWDQDGNFVGATITLGSELDEGYPPPVYYPVLNALQPDPLAPSISPSTLAAAKLSHELGHVEQTASTSMDLLQLQSRLVPQYVSIFLKNGLNRNDKRLVDLEKQIGGTPTSIWEGREYTSELDTMRYVAQRFNVENGLCAVLKRVRRNLDDYGRSYEKNFADLPEFSGVECR